jgi:hypothetical protein
MSESEYRSSGEKGHRKQSATGHAVREGRRRNSVIIDEAGDVYETSEERKTIGLTSAVFLILNRMIGTGEFFCPCPVVVCGRSQEMDLNLRFSSVRKMAEGFVGPALRVQDLSLRG